VNEELLGKYIRAFEVLDFPALVELLHVDIVVSMPPSPTWLRGKADATAFLAVRPFVTMAKRRRRFGWTSANSQPALVFYLDDQLHALSVTRWKDGRVIELHHFCDPESFASAFGLAARTVPG
jgi:RNA polymerase sigma-70 factor (ECF subfamily)